ncbi:MAG: HAD family hydrolase [Nitrososphaeraceae archaeon]
MNVIFADSDLQQIAEQTHQDIDAFVTTSDAFNIRMSRFSSVSGQGVLAYYQERRIFVGTPHNSINILSNNSNNLGSNQIIPVNMQTKIAELEEEGKTVIIIFVEERLAGLIAIADTLRDNAKYMVNEIKNMRKDILLLSGDNKKAAVAIAKKVGIDKIMAQVSP